MSHYEKEPCVDEFSVPTVVLGSSKREYVTPSCFTRFLR